MDVQDWIQCPNCGSDGAYLKTYPQDGDGNLTCPDCEVRVFDVIWKADSQNYA